MVVVGVSGVVFLVRVVVSIVVVVVGVIGVVFLVRVVVSIVVVSVVLLLSNGMDFVVRVVFCCEINTGKLIKFHFQ